MAKYFKTLLLATLFLFTSCQEGSEAGDLLGQWRLIGTDSKYVSFSGSVTQFLSVFQGEAYGKFQHQGDSLFIQCVTCVPADSVVVEESFGFKPFGNIRLKINVLNDEKLVVSKGDKMWSFEKY